MNESEKINYLVQELAAASVERDRYHKDWNIASDCINSITTILTSKEQNFLVDEIKRVLLKYHEKTFPGHQTNWEEYTQALVSGPK